MGRLFKIAFFPFSFLFFFYLLLPNPSFPDPPPDSLQSNEPADTETFLRRAYFTNFSREEVMLHYTRQLKTSGFINFPLPTYRLNYPPEEAQTMIRDQTRSTFLEEIVHPFRESLFVNGFEPKDPKDAILIEGRSWRQKITVRFVPSNLVARVVLALTTLTLLWLLTSQWFRVLGNFKRRKKGGR